jgi:predicted phosphodiesterase
MLPGRRLRFGSFGIRLARGEVMSAQPESVPDIDVSASSPSAEAGRRVYVLPAPLTHVTWWSAGAVVVAVAAGLLAFALFAHATFDVGPATLNVSARPSLGGSTTLSLPPFGSVSAPTHPAPLAVSATLEELDLQRLQSLALGGIPGPRTIDAFKAEATRGAMKAVGKGLMAALIVAAFVGWALRRSWQATLTAGVLGIAVPALLVASTALGFHAEAFRSPKYTGVMKYAPSLISLVQGRIERVGNLQAQLDDAVAQLNAYYSHPQSFAGGGTMPNTYRVLEVSDLHLDPVGMKLESELAQEFNASLILDCGDADDYGTPVEGTLLQRFLPTTTRRLFIPGNHESPSTVNAIGSVRGVTVLKEGRVTIDGLTIYGLADPMSRSNGWKPDNDQTLREAQAAAERLKAAEATGGAKPQIIATHNPVGLEPFAGMAPLMVAGHTHTPDLGHIGTSWYVNSGTVGGVDFKLLYSDPSIAHGASILYYTQTLPRRLIAIDQIAVSGRTDESSLKRTVVDPTLLEQLKAAEKPASKKPAKTVAPKG